MGPFLVSWQNQIREGACEPDGYFLNQEFARLPGSSLSFDIIIG